MSAAQKLEELDNDAIEVGDFFDQADRQYMASVNIYLNDSSDLIPNINIASHNTESDSPSFANNGDQIVLQASDQEPDDPSFDMFTVGSPERTSAGSDDESAVSASASSDSFFLQTRDYPHVIYTESGSDSESDVAPARWKNRQLKCVKYVDDCLSIEKLCFAGTNLNSETNTRSLGRCKLRNTLRQ